jgi:hypothetical protein
VAAGGELGSEGGADRTGANDGDAQLRPA